MTDMACVGDMNLAPELEIVPHNMNGKIGRIHEGTMPCMVNCGRLKR